MPPLDPSPELPPAGLEAPPAAEHAAAGAGSPVDPRRAAPRPHAIVLGIDPGTNVLGYGALVAVPGLPRLLAAGEVRGGGARSTVPERLGTIRRELDALLARLDPDVVVVEKAFAGRNVQSALRMGEGRGVVLACAACHGAEVIEITPAEAKKVLVGNGAADKRQVARMVAILLERAELPGTLDVTDALALALAYLQRSRSPGRGVARSDPGIFAELIARLVPKPAGAPRRSAPRRPR